MFGIKKDKTPQPKITFPKIEDFYSGRATMTVQFEEKELAYDVEMFDNIAKVYGDRFVPDCKISHFGYNHHFRTNLGMSNTKQYKSVGSLKQAITLSAKVRGLTVKSFTVAFDKNKAVA